MITIGANGVMRQIPVIAILTALAVAMVAFSTSTYAQSTPQPAASDSARQPEIQSLELKLADLIVREKWDDYEKYLAPDFTRISDNGALEDRNEVMAAFRNGPRKIIILEPENLQVRMYGNTAVLQGVMTVSARESGRVTTRRESTTDVFVKRDGQWYLVTEHQTAGK